MPRINIKAKSTMREKELNLKLIIWFLFSMSVIVFSMATAEETKLKSLISNNAPTINLQISPYDPDKQSLRSILIHCNDLRLEPDAQFSNGVYASTSQKINCFEINAIVESISTNFQLYYSVRIQNSKENPPNLNNIEEFYNLSQNKTGLIINSQYLSKSSNYHIYSITHAELGEEVDKLLKLVTSTTTNTSLKEKIGNLLSTAFIEKIQSGSNTIISETFDSHMKTAEAYVKKTRLSAERADVKEIQAIHDAFQASNNGPIITSVQIWNYGVKEKYGLVFSYKNDKYPSSTVKFNPSNNPSISKINGHIIFRYWDRNSRNELGLLNYRVEFKN